MWGSITKIQKLGNGRLNLSLSASDRPYTNINIRGLDPNPDRHPVLQTIQEGEQVALYNLQGNASTGAFSETCSTVVYWVLPISTNKYDL